MVKGLEIRKEKGIKNSSSFKDKIWGWRSLVGCHVETAVNVSSGALLNSPMGKQPSWEWIGMGLGNKYVKGHNLAKWSFFLQPELNQDHLIHEKVYSPSRFIYWEEVQHWLIHFRPSFEDLFLNNYELMMFQLFRDNQLLVLKTQNFDFCGSQAKQVSDKIGFIT